MRVAVLPYDLLGRTIDLNDARVRRGLLVAERAVIEDHDRAIGALRSAVLLGNDRGVEMPKDSTRSTRDDDYSGGRAEGGKDVAVLQ